MLWLCACTQKEPIKPISDTETRRSEKDADASVLIQYQICRTGGGTIEGWRSQHGKPGETVRVPVTAVPRTGYVFRGWSDGVTEPTRADVFREADWTVTANFSVDRLELPIVTITTATNRDVFSKEEYIGAVVSVCNTGNVLYEMSGVEAQIRGRGNGTWEYPKKSYRLKFTHSQNMLGLGTAKHKQWILMANHADRSMVRNYLAIDLANRLSGIGYNNHAAFVELYLNEEYRGVYLLAEQIEDDADRVDIGTETLADPNAEDAGFLVELDEYAKEEDRFYIDGQPFEIKNANLNAAQRAYVVRYIEDVNDAIKDGDRERLAALTDLDSFIDGYLLEEFFKNIDAGWSSYYMHKKPGEKMVFGPFWDFDLSAGNNISLDGGAWDGIYVGRRTGFAQEHFWYSRITRNAWFCDAVRARWTEILPDVNATIAELERIRAAAPKAFARNYEVWPIQDETLWHIPDDQKPLTTWQAHIEYLHDWLTSRRDFLTAYFNSDDAYAFQRRAR